jgi:outer membrane lipoprotein-sorting protein
LRRVVSQSCRLKNTLHDADESSSSFGLLLPLLSILTPTAPTTNPSTGHAACLPAVWGTGRTLLDDYTVTLDGTERIDGRRTWRVQFEARRRNVAYPRQTMWIDQEWYVPLRAEQRALNGRLLKEIRSEDIQQVSGRWIPHRMIISDVLKRDSTTTVEIQRIEIGIPLDTQIFSLEELSW